MKMEKLSKTKQISLSLEIIFDLMGVEKDSKSLSIKDIQDYFSKMGLDLLGEMEAISPYYVFEIFEDELFKQNAKTILRGISKYLDDDTHKEEICFKCHGTREDGMAVSGVTKEEAEKIDREMVNRGELFKFKKSDKLKSSIETHKNCVYRWLDADGRVLYIGKAKDLLSRMKQHIKDQDDELHLKWYKHWNSIEYIEFDDYGSCSLAEMYFIMRHKPIGNISLANKDFNTTIDFFEDMIWEEYTTSSNVNDNYKYYMNDELYYVTCWGNMVREMRSLLEYAKKEGLFNEN